MAAAVFARPVARLTRLVWLVVGGALLVEGVLFPKYTTAFVPGGLPTIRELWDATIGIGALLVAPPWIDLPTLFVLGTAATLLVRRDAWFWRSVIGLQLGLVVLLALTRGGQPPYGHGASSSSTSTSWLRRWPWRPSGCFSDDDARCTSSSP
jgi:hypothetical protein